MELVLEYVFFSDAFMLLSCCCAMSTRVYVNGVLRLPDKVQLRPPIGRAHDHRKARTEPTAATPSAHRATPCTRSPPLTGMAARAVRNRLLSAYSTDPMP